MDICKKKFKEARDLAYSSYERQSALDSALYLTNECLQCDSIRKAVIDFKIVLLITMKRFKEGIYFVDSLKESDFTFGYKKNLISKNLRALDLGSKNEIAKQNLIYKEISNDIEQYLKIKEVDDKEFKEIFTDLFAVKGNYLNASQINKEVEELKKVYPGMYTFFDFFKK